MAHQLVTYTADEDTDVGAHDMRLVVSLPDPLYPTLAKDFVVTILTPVCDCSLLVWQAPAAETFATTVKKIPSDVFTISKSTVVESSKAASPKIRACYIAGGPSCDETTVITSLIESGSTFPTYFTRSGDDVTINAVDNAQARTYLMEVTHSTVDSGDKTFSTVTISVGWCVITGVSAPSQPSASDAAYTVFATAKTITLTPQFEQVPACGYTLVEDIQWTIPSTSPITVTADKYVLSVESTDGLNHHATNTVIVQNNVEYEGSTWSPSVTFDIVITDPCRTSVITDVTLTAMTVVLGEEAF